MRYLTYFGLNIIMVLSLGACADNYSQGEPYRTPLAIGVGALISFLVLLIDTERVAIAEYKFKTSETAFLREVEAIRGLNQGQMDFFNKHYPHLEILSGSVNGSPVALANFQGVALEWIIEFLLEATPTRLRSIRSYKGVQQDWASVITHALMEMRLVEWDHPNKPAIILTTWNECWSAMIPKVTTEPVPTAPRYDDVKPI